MRRQRDGQGDPRAKKRAQESAERLTFLEKLVARAQSTRQVPAESGVQFAISSKAREDGICLVFLVDDPHAPIVEEGPRPDYLVVHASRNGCVMTIVEMKGREQKNIEHGILAAPPNDTIAEAEEDAAEATDALAAAPPDDLPRWRVYQAGRDATATRHDPDPDTIDHLGAVVAIREGDENDRDPWRGLESSLPE